MPIYTFEEYLEDWNTEHFMSTGKIITNRCAGKTETDFNAELNQANQSEN